MKKFCHILLAAAALAALLGLWGCSGSASGDAAPTVLPSESAAPAAEQPAVPQTPQPTPTPTPTPEPTPTPTPAPVEIDGVLIPWDAQFVDLSGHDLAGQEVDLYALLDSLEMLERIDLCGCGYSNDEMAALQDAFPDIKVIWEIVLSHWTIRTDVVAFSTMKTCADPFFMEDDEAKYLKYCNELVALDIGHNHVKDISFLQYMPDLKILILVDNVDHWTKDGYAVRLSDLSVLQYTPKLVYLEFFCNSVKDLSFLQYTPDLVDLNISYNSTSDVENLYGLTKLERLWMEHTKIPYSEFKKLQASYPDAELIYYGEGSIDHGWRKHERYFAMREMFNTNTIHPLFAD